MNQTPPTRITADEFRALLAKVNAPADFVEEELERWRARDLILPDPEPEPVEVALAATLEKAVFQDERSRVPYSNGFRKGFEAAEGVTKSAVADRFRKLADKALEAWKEEENKSGMGDVFWRRYWAGFFTALDTASKEMTEGYHIMDDPVINPAVTFSDQQRLMLIRGELPSITMVPRDDDGITYIMFTTEEEIIPIGFDDAMLDELRALFGQPKLVDLETVIADTMSSGNDITPFEIAEAVRDRFTIFLEELSQ